MKHALTDKLSVLPKLDDEIIELINGDALDTVEQADVTKVRIGLTILSIEDAITTLSMSQVDEVSSTHSRGNSQSENDSNEDDNEQSALSESALNASTSTTNVTASDTLSTTTTTATASLSSGTPTYTAELPMTIPLPPHQASTSAGFPEHSTSLFVQSFTPPSLPPLVLQECLYQLVCNSLPPIRPLVCAHYHSLIPLTLTTCCPPFLQ